MSILCKVLSCLHPLLPIPTSHVPREPNVNTPPFKLDDWLDRPLNRDDVERVVSAWLGQPFNTQQVDYWGGTYFPLDPESPVGEALYVTRKGNDYYLTLK